MAKLLLYQIISYNVEIKWEYELKKLHIFSVFFTQKFAYIKYQKLFFVQQFHRKMKVFSWKIYLEVAKFKIGNRYAMSIFFFWIMHFFANEIRRTNPLWVEVTDILYFLQKKKIILSQICKMKLQNSSWDKTKPIIRVNSLHFCNNLLHLFKDLEKTSNDCNRLQMQVMHVQISSR